MLKVKPLHTYASLYAYTRSFCMTQSRMNGLLILLNIEVTLTSDWLTVVFIILLFHCQVVVWEYIRNNNCVNLNRHSATEIFALPELLAVRTLREIDRW